MSQIYERWKTLIEFIVKQVIYLPFIKHAKFGDNERKNRLGQIQHEGERSTNFEGSNIVTFKNSDGEYVKYALRRDKDGQLNGSTFKVVTREGGVTKNLGLRPPNYQEDSNSMIVGVQQMSKSDLDAMEEILKAGQVNERSVKAGNSENFSVLIREGVPHPEPVAD